MSKEKTHYRKAFDSPYLSAADITQPTILTVQRVVLQIDQTKKTKDVFNTAFFVEKEIRNGEKLKPMILNSTNSKTLKQLTGSAFIEDWAGQRISVYVDPHVRFGKETVEGLRISPFEPEENKTQVDEKSLVNEGWEAAHKGMVSFGAWYNNLPKSSNGPHRQIINHVRQLMIDKANEVDNSKEAQSDSN